MGIEVKWLEPQVLLFQLQPPFTWSELKCALDDSIVMVNAVPDQTVGTVLDVNGIINKLRGCVDRGMTLLRRKPDNAGPVMLIKVHPAIKAFYRLVRVLHPSTGRLIHFADDRRAGIAQLRCTLRLER
jgi:hypothetical protein